MSVTTQDALGGLRMTLRRLTVATVLLCGLCVWGFAHSGETPVPDAGPVDGRTTSGIHEAEARFRSNQSRHWRHVAIGNASTSP